MAIEAAGFANVRLTRYRGHWLVYNPYIGGVAGT